MQTNHISEPKISENHLWLHSQNDNKVDVSQNERKYSIVAIFAFRLTPNEDKKENQKRNK